MTSTCELLNWVRVGNWGRIPFFFPLASLEETIAGFGH